MIGAPPCPYEREHGGGSGTRIPSSLEAGPDATGGEVTPHHVRVEWQLHVVRDM